MTNLTATIVVLLSTNWVAVDTLQGRKEVGVVVENTYVRTVESIYHQTNVAPKVERSWAEQSTNDWLRSSRILGQANVREPLPVIAWPTNWSGRQFIILTNASPL